jgi:uncharacterized membrane protein YbaN (DUF454 family)
MLKPAMRIALLAVGVLCVILGVIGIFLPILPTTPFLLLAAACFARSCDSCHAWLLEHRWFGSFIRNWYERRGVTRRQKTAALAMLWAGIGVSIAFGSELWWVRLMLVAIATCTTLYLVLVLKTVDP